MNDTYEFKCSNIVKSEVIDIEYRKYKTVVLCGSTRFKQDFEKVAKELALQGKIPIPLPFFGDPITAEQLALITDMHFEKIRLSDEIYVINKDGYIGDATRKEIEYAKSLNKPIFYMEAINNAK